MFDAFRNRPGQEGFLRGGERVIPRIETLEERAVPAIIGGMVYNDLNSNGLWEGNEPGIANSTLQLYNAQGTVIATTTSNSSGQYQFVQKDNIQTGPGDITQEVTFDNLKTNHQRSGSFNLFDSNLGTLSSVEILAEGTFHVNSQLENIEDQPADLQTEIHGQMGFSLGNTVLNSTQADQTVTAHLPAFDGTADLLGSSSKDLGDTQVSATFNHTVLSSPSDLAAFTGSGTSSVTENASVTTCSGGPAT